VVLALLALSFTFGPSLSAHAATSAEQKASGDSYRAKAVEKVARLSNSRITQEQRDAAAAQMKLMEAVAAIGSSSAAPGMIGRQSVVSASLPTPGPGGVPDYFGETANWAYSPLLRKFVDRLPGLGQAGANNLGQYIGVAKPDTITYPGSDYYEIELRQFSEKMHSDMPPTTLRGYVQVNKGTDSHGANTLEPDPIHYLGPFIVANKDRPVRIKFTNKLPTGEAGDLFIPVDESVMGAGEGPIEGKKYTQNRATLHLHGGITPWISDGTPHQWITPASEVTSYPIGVSVKNVPDMPDPGPGSMTFFYTNQQSARLMFYHDHSFGITRLNVYAGEAAGYLIRDDAEKQLIADGTIPRDEIPLIIQDKTFVDANTITETDPTWNWGITPGTPHTGDLWVPHVYIPAQNPAMRDGVNPTGRWHYAPWFWPPVTNIAHGPIPNPYYDPENAPWEYKDMPATPNPSMGMEAFHDTPLVNGTAYPVLEVQPKSYRLRILNAANDRFFNLQMYVADGSVATDDGRRNTEVKMVPAEVPKNTRLVRVFRFYNSKKGSYYYTASEREKDSILRARNKRHYLYRGVAYTFNAESPYNTAPLYRILNVKKGVYVYTTSDAEKRSMLRKGRKKFRDKGVAYNVSNTAVPTSLPVYRFFSSTKGAYFYTASESEKSLYLRKYRKTWRYQGVAYYIVPGESTASDYPALWPTDGRPGGVPDPKTAGPEWIQIGTEGGFLPKPAIIPQQPVTWVTDPTVFNMGNVQDHSLLLGCAERADVVVDFSKYAGKTLILYNDAPTAFPALDPRTDFFTADEDLTDTGGTKPTKAGYGPNTRTVMQIKVAAAAPAPAYNLAKLNAAFASSDTKDGVFKASQNPIIIPDARYNEAYNASFDKDPYVRIWQTLNTTFKRLDSTTVTMPLQPKAIHDEASAAWDPEYGRMSGKLGIERLGTNAVNQNLILYGFADPTTEVLQDAMTPLSSVSPTDGTQVWKITHNGVDTHPIHFHLYDVQLINRVGWDGFIRAPDDNELGWKDTVRISPLEDTIVALKPVAPKLPFGLPDSERPLNPAMPIGSEMGFTNIDPVTGQAPATRVTNQVVNFGWEYVWHCHILSHEEMDMMRPQQLNVLTSKADAPTVQASGSPGQSVALSWTDGTPANLNDLLTWGDPKNEIAFRVERAVVTAGVPGEFGQIGTTLANVTTYTDETTMEGAEYAYRVVAKNQAGEVISPMVLVPPVVP
jgi:FtsP/CotA-like multicopper oxidase with cupredoxin domain